MKKIAIVFALISILSSCTRDEIVKPDNADLEFPGILSFKDSNEFFAVIDSLKNLSPDLVKGYSSEKGFISLFTIQENFYECLDYVTDEAEFHKLIADHQDVLIDGSNTFFKVANKVVYPVINREGIVKIGNYLHKFTEDGQIVITNSDLDHLLRSTTNDQENSSKFILRYKELPFTKTIYCSDDHSLVSIPNYDNNRRASLYSKLVYTWVPNDYYQGTWMHKYRTDAWSEGIAEKKGIFGWRTYNTLNTLSLDYRVVLNGGIAKTTSYYSAPTSEAYRIYYQDIIAEGHTSNINLQESFEGIYNWINVNSYTHRGMQGIVLTIECEEDPYGK